MDKFLFINNLGKEIKLICINIYSNIKQIFYITVCLCFLTFATVYFFTQISSNHSFTNFFLVGLLFLSASTDLFLISIVLFRKSVKHQNLSFDRDKMTVVIACHNGEKVIGETIRQVLTKVPSRQIIVISDLSNDNTVEIAHTYQVRVIENQINLNKALSISQAIEHVKTPYTLILDDDTHIEKTFIPTSLLDDGYSAVAFNVMPEVENTLINKLQQYEYRKSMFLGKSLRASVGAIGNVSGAIGLFKTKDLSWQATRHSGQFGGEDQQRTMFVHLNRRKGKGITYCHFTVLTEPPDTFPKLIKQRAKSWNCSTHETLFLCCQMILSSKTHFLLKLERSYLLFIFFTEPLRMLFFTIAIFYPFNFLLLYGFYLIIEIFAYLKTGRKDSLLTVILSPLYGLFKIFCRFFAYFWWFKLKYDYLFKKKLYKFITHRKLLAEYFVTTSVVFILVAYAATVYLKYVLVYIN